MALEEQFAAMIEGLVLQLSVKTLRSGKAINLGEQSCDVEVEGEPTFTDVRFCVLQTSLNNKIIIKPKSGSDVIIGIIDNLKTEAFIAQCSEIESVEITIGSVQLLINETGVVVKKGDDNLLQALQLLIEAVLQISIIYGNNPNFMKLNESLRIIQNILKNA